MQKIPKLFKNTLGFSLSMSSKTDADEANEI